MSRINLNADASCLVGAADVSYNINNTLTLCAWVYREASGREGILFKGVSGSIYSWSLEVLAGTDKLYFYDDNNGGLQSTGTVGVGVWTHVAFVISASTTYTFYINGLASGTGSCVTIPAGGGQALRLGSNGDAGNGLNGRLAYVGIRSLDCTAGEIATIAATPAIVVPETVAGAWLSSWHLNTSALTDSGSVLNDLTVTGTFAFDALNPPSLPATGTTTNPTIYLRQGQPTATTIALYDPLFSGGDSTMPLTGVEATGSADTLTPTETLAVAGVEGTASAGSVLAVNTEALSGVAATGSAGSVTVTDAPALSGVSGTGAIGQVTANNTEALSGVGATGSAGSVTAGSSVTAALEGVAGTGSAGSLTASTDKALSGTSASSAIGSLEVATSLPLEGVTLTGSAGTITAGNDKTAALTGVSATASAGELGVDTLNNTGGIDETEAAEPTPYYRATPWMGPEARHTGTARLVGHAPALHAKGRVRKPIRIVEPDFTRLTRTTQDDAERIYTAAASRVRVRHRHAGAVCANSPFARLTATGQMFPVELQKQWQEEDDALLRHLTDEEFIGML